MKKIITIAALLVALTAIGYAADTAAGTPDTIERNVTVKKNNGDKIDLKISVPAALQAYNLVDYYVDTYVSGFARNWNDELRIYSGVGAANQKKYSEHRIEWQTSAPKPDEEAIAKQIVSKIPDPKNDYARTVQKNRVQSEASMIVKMANGRLAGENDSVKAFKPLGHQLWPDQKAFKDATQTQSLQSQK